MNVIHDWLGITGPPQPPGHARTHAPFPKLDLDIEPLDEEILDDEKNGDYPLEGDGVLLDDCGCGGD